MKRLSNKDFKARGLDAMAPGFETVINYATGSIQLHFWRGFFDAGNIVDRWDGKPARKQTVVLIDRDGSGYAYCTDPGVRGAIRYGWAKTEEQAIEAASAWIRRRFAHVTLEAK